MNTDENFEQKSTFDLAFGLATNQFKESDKLIVLSIIRNRESGATNKSVTPTSTEDEPKERTFKEGSKAAKINELYQQGKTPKQIFDLLNKKGTTVYFPEIYRVTGTVKK